MSILRCLFPLLALVPSLALAGTPASQASTDVLVAAIAEDGLPELIVVDEIAWTKASEVEGWAGAGQPVKRSALDAMAVDYVVIGEIAILKEGLAVNAADLVEATDGAVELQKGSLVATFDTLIGPGLTLEETTSFRPIWNPHTAPDAPDLLDAWVPVTELGSALGVDYVELGGLLGG